MPTKKIIGAAAIAAALTGGGIAGTLLGTPTLSLAQTDDTTTTEPADQATDEEGPRRHFRRHGPALDVAAEALGITEDELRTALRDGSTIAEVAEAEGVDVQTVIDAMVAEATAKIDDEVAEGDIDADRAEELKANLPDRITELVNEGGPIGHHGHHRGPALDVAAEALGMTEDELKAALEDGSTIAEVAEAEGVDVQTVIDALVAAATARIDDEVAEGDLDADRAAEMKEGLVDKMTELVNSDLPLRGPGGPGGPGHHGRHLIDPDVAADSLGITPEELREAIRGGSSIAQLAEENGVDVQAVIDALVADATADIDEKVADGDLDADRAAELKEGLVDRITELVNREGGFRGGPDGPPG